MTTNLEKLQWNDLLRQIQQNPDPKSRQEATREALSRVWGGYNGDESRIPMSVFELE